MSRFYLLLEFSAWLWDCVPCVGKAVPCAGGEHGDRCGLRAGAAAAPSVGTAAVPPRFERNAFAALVAAACVYQKSSYLSNSQSWLVLRLSLPRSQPSLFRRCLYCVSKANGTQGAWGRPAAAFGMEIRGGKSLLWSRVGSCCVLPAVTQCVPWALGGFVAPASGRHVGMCPGCPGEHTLRPGPVLSLLSSTVLLFALAGGK